MDVIKLNPEIEVQLPQEIQQVRRFLEQEVKIPKEVQNDKDNLQFY